MLKKEIFIGLLIAVFSLGLIGVTFADDPGQNLSEEVNTHIAKNTGEITQMTGTEDEEQNLDVRSWVNDSEPLVCDTDLAPATKQFASNECAGLSEDLYRS